MPKPDNDHFMRLTLFAALGCAACKAIDIILNLIALIVIPGVLAVATFFGVRLLWRRQQATA